MIFFSNFDCLSRGPFHRKDFKWKKLRGARLISEKNPEILYAELNKRAETATSSNSATDDFLQHIFSMSDARNHQEI